MAKGTDWANRCWLSGFIQKVRLRDHFSFDGALILWKHVYWEAPAAELDCPCRVKQEGSSALWQ